MTLVVLPYPTIKPGDPRDATQLQANFNAIRDTVNGLLADDNFAPAAGVNQSKIASGYPPSKLAKEGAVTNVGLVWDASQGKWQTAMPVPTAVYKTGVENMISNVATEQTWASFTIPAGALSTNRIMFVKGGGAVSQGTGSNQTLTYRIKYGATTLFAHTHTYVSSANARPLAFNIALCALSATSQRMAGRLATSDATTAPASGSGEIGAIGFPSVIAGTSAENSAGALTFAITVQMGVANGAYIIRRSYLWAGIWS